jgi:hypothetical protein
LVLYPDNEIQEFRRRIRNKNNRRRGIILMEGKIVYIILILLGIYLILGEFTATGKKYLSRFVKSIIPG